MARKSFLKREAEASPLGSSIPGSPIHTTVGDGMFAEVIEAIKQGNLTMSESAEEMGSSNHTDHSDTAPRKNDTRSKSVERMARRMNAELEIIIDEVKEIDEQIQKLQDLRSEKMHAASMLSHGLAAGE